MGSRSDPSRAPIGLCGQLALGLDHALVQLGVTLLRVSQLHVQLFKAGFGGDAALLQLFQQSL